MEQKGEPIKGSRYVRDFCTKCDEPIRAVSVDVANYCITCEPKQPHEHWPGMRLAGEKLHLGKEKK